MKVMFVLWPGVPYTPRQRRKTLLDTCAGKILRHDVAGLCMNIDDEYSQVKSPAPKWYKGPAIVATVSAYFTDAQNNENSIDAIRRILTEAGFKVGTYRVEESLYSDYGDNTHYHKRDWEDGVRSPTVLAVTLLTRPKKYPHAEWIRRWHGKMSPVSERLQPRARYVRNVVLSHWADSMAFDGIVEEAWPTAEHIRNPYLFYCADNLFQLIKHMFQMVKVIMQFHQLHKIRTVTMSEYFLKTPERVV